MTAVSIAEHIFASCDDSFVVLEVVDLAFFFLLSELDIANIEATERVEDFFTTEGIFFCNLTGLMTFCFFSGLEMIARKNANSFPIVRRREDSLPVAKYCASIAA